VEIIRIKPAYTALIQKPLCCAVTCLQMILFRNGFGLWDQEELAIKFGVRISPEHAAAFTAVMPRMTKPNCDEGVQTVESEDQINAFLREHDIGLVAKCHKYTPDLSIADFVSEQLEANHDVWVEYHAHEIHACDRSQGQYIHDGLIESLDRENGVATVLDPSPNHRQRLSIAIPVLRKAISEEFDSRATGFVSIRRKE
jgi:hypothetical protein